MLNFGILKHEQVVFIAHFSLFLYRRLCETLVFLRSAARMRFRQKTLRK